MATFKLNRLTKTQRQEREREMVKASSTALKTYFLGVGSLKRVTRFLIAFLLHTAWWTVVATSVAITALLWVLFMAPGNTHLLAKIGVLFAGWPIKKIDASVASYMVGILEIGIWIGVFVALLKTLDPIVGPAQSVVKAKWKGESR